MSLLAQRGVLSWKAAATWMLIPAPRKASEAAAICIPRHPSLAQTLTASFSFLLSTSEAADGLPSYCRGVNLSCVKLSVLKEAVSGGSCCRDSRLEISHSHPAAANQGLEAAPRTWNEESPIPAHPPAAVPPSAVLTARPRWSDGRPLDEKCPQRRAR